MNLETRLSVTTPDGNYNVAYGDLLSLGGTYALEYFPKRKLNIPENAFLWFFRTGFKDYDRQALLIRKWVYRLFDWTVRYRHESRSDWRSGFLAYDEINMGDLNRVKTYESFTRFAGGLDAFIDDLNNASLIDDGPRVSFP